jgi:tetratricopeptide (TPR) repeat protein
MQIDVQGEVKEIIAPGDLGLECKRAKELEEAGEFEEARKALSQFWVELGQRPLTDGLLEPSQAELLLRAGSLTGWLGSTRQMHGAQEVAKDLISESASISKRLGDREKFAEATIDLAICYWREGGLDEARVTLKHALDSLGDLKSEQRLRALLNSAIIEQVAGRYREALSIYQTASPLADLSSNTSLKGKFHNSYALFLKNLGLAKESEEHIDRALVEFAAARFHFEECGHKRFLARVENNEGFLFASLGRFKEAHEHLDRARALDVNLGDLGSTASVDDTRAQAFLLEGKTKEAETAARSAVRVFERGGEQTALAEALTTYGKALARLLQGPVARSTLNRAIEVAQSAGDPDSGGIAALTVIEELGGTLEFKDLLHYYRTAESLLTRSQHPRVGFRLGECARRVLAAEVEARGVETGEARAIEAPAEASPDASQSCSLEAEVLRYEGSLIRNALEASGGSVTRAARLLGVTHQGLAFILNGRHKDLLSVRTPVKRRRRSIIRRR